MSHKHSFNRDLAVKYGLQEAILIHFFQCRISLNKYAGKNEIKGRTWFCQTQKWITNHFPYWKDQRKAERLIRSLVDKKVLIKGTFNQYPCDRTLWYAFVDEDEFIFDESYLKENFDSSTFAFVEKEDDVKKH